MEFCYAYRFEDRVDLNGILKSSLVSAPWTRQSVRLESSIKNHFRANYAAGKWLHPSGSMKKKNGGEAEQMSVKLKDGLDICLHSMEGN